MAVGEQRGAGAAVLEEKTATAEEDEGEGGGKREGDAAPPAEENRDCVVVDVAGSADGAADGGNDRDAETPCRICQLRPDRGQEVSLQVLLGCWCNDGEERGEADPEVARPPEEAAVVVALEERVAVEMGAAFVVVDVAGSADGAADGSDWDTAMACRICHLSPDRFEEGSELFQLGCGCKGELGVAHRHCAEAWFKVKGNRYCEICGENAKNVTGEDDSKFMNEWYERGDSSNRNVSERCSCWRHQPFCNFLMACLVIAFMLPWFLRSPTWMLSNSFLPPFLGHGGKKTSNAGISHAFLVSISHLLLKSSNRNLSPSPSITPIASTVKSKMRILVTMAKLVDTLIGPAVMLLYPLYSSMRAIESPSPVDDQQWLTYWVLYSFITLFELSCWRVLQWFPLWPYLKLVFCVWLVLPFFNGAAYIYENHVRRYVRIGTGVGSTYSGLQRRVMQMVSLDARRSIEQFLDGHGAEALEKVVRAAEKEARSRSRK